MTFPVWIEVGPGRLHPHLAFELLAYLAAAVTYVIRRSRQGDHISAEHRWALVTAAVMGAVAGSRLLFWLEDPRETLARLDDLTYLVGGQTIVGGLLGGWIAVEWQKRHLGIREATGDLFAQPVAIGAAVGRVGCFLTGLSDGTHGIATSMPWGIDLGDGVSRHPTALYESLFLFGLAWWLSTPRTLGVRGDRFKWLMTAYLAFRLAIEFIKPGVPVALGFTAIQWACVAGLAYNLRWVIQKTRLAT